MLVKVTGAIHRHETRHDRRTIAVLEIDPTPGTWSHRQRRSPLVVELESTPRESVGIRDNTRTGESREPGDSHVSSLLGQHSDGPVLLFLPERNERTEQLVCELQRVNPCVRPVVRAADNPPDDAVVLEVSDGGIEIR